MKIGRAILGNLFAHRCEGGGDPPEFVLQMIRDGHLDGDRDGASATLVRRYAERMMGTRLGISWFGNGAGSRYDEIVVVLRLPNGQTLPVQIRNCDDFERVTHDTLVRHGVL